MHLAYNKFVAHAVFTGFRGTQMRLSWSFAEFIAAAPVAASRSPKSARWRSLSSFSARCVVPLVAAAWASGAFAQAANCPFALTGQSTARLAIDGVALSRFSTGKRSPALVGALTNPPRNAAQEEAIETAIADASRRLDMDGDGFFSTVDAAIIARYLAGFEPTAWLAGLPLPTAAQRRTGVDVAAYINAGCVAPARMAKADAARLLTQATFGPTIATINDAQTKTPTQWVNEQLALPLHNPSHWKYVVIDKGPKGDSRYINATMESFWLQAVRGSDQLRQRTVLALSEIFVVSTVNSAVDIQEDAHASYLDMLSRNAFGNFRTLLEEVSLHPTMAVYLSSFKNEKEVPGGRQPDENYAREVMQLFTIGLWQLNSDGTRKVDAAGKWIPTYGQDDIKGMARVFTGWNWGQDGPSRDYNNWYPPTRWDLLMDPYPDFHSTSEKAIVNGVVIPPNTNARASMKIALDTLFNHPNVGAFIGGQLIKRFVTSNPSPAYVARVTAAFNNNGANVRGDMKAVMRAILVDDEARNNNRITDPFYGKLREPMIRYANFMRAFDVKSSAPIIYRIWNLEDPVSSLGQNPLRSPSVFNWYRPDYAPPGAVLATGRSAPEFQITHETTVTGYTNFIVEKTERETESSRAFFAQYGDVSEYLAANVSAELALADQPDALLDRLDLLLLSGQMQPWLRDIVKQAINNIPLTADRSRDQRVAVGTALIMASPQYLVQK
jgi:uncharacterized protein (DUF1800 family)